MFMQIMFVYRYLLSCVCERGRDGSHPFFSLNVLVKTIELLVLCYNNSEELRVIRESEERERGERRGGRGEGQKEREAEGEREIHYLLILSPLSLSLSFLLGLSQDNQ